MFVDFVVGWDAKFVGIAKGGRVSKRLRTSALAFTVINFICELIAQKLDDNGIHSIYGFYWKKS